MLLFNIYSIYAPRFRYSPLALGCIFASVKIASSLREAFVCALCAGSSAGFVTTFIPPLLRCAESSSLPFASAARSVVYSGKLQRSSRSTSLKQNSSARRSFASVYGKKKVKKMKNILCYHIM